MTNTFSTLVLEVHFLGIEAVEVENKDTKTMVLFYFCREPDSTEIPLSLTEDQARQLYNDLRELFSEYTI